MPRRGVGRDGRLFEPWRRPPDSLSAGARAAHADLISRLVARRHGSLGADAETRLRVRVAPDLRLARDVPDDGRGARRGGLVGASRRQRPSASKRPAMPTSRPLPRRRSPLLRSPIPPRARSLGDVHRRRGPLIPSGSAGAAGRETAAPRSFPRYVLRMHRNRTIASACLAVASLLIAACSGGERATESRPAAAARSTTQATEPPPRATAAETEAPASSTSSSTDTPSAPAPSAPAPETSSPTASAAPPSSVPADGLDAGAADPCAHGGRRRSRNERCRASWPSHLRDPWAEFPDAMPY